MAKKKKHKKNYLLEKIVEVISTKPVGSILDLGCGDGKTGKRLQDKGFSVVAADMDETRFEYKKEIPFKKIDLNEILPFQDDAFDYIIFMEVIEHIYNPDFVISQISRILKPGGSLILSTPNILNIGSRFRFLFEGSFDFFREPILDYSKIFPMGIQNMHVVAWRYHELEYLLAKNHLNVSEIYTDLRKANLKFLTFFMRPILSLQCYLKELRAKKKGGVDFRRINKIALSPEILMGRHLILESQKFAC